MNKTIEEVIKVIDEAEKLHKAKADAIKEQLAELEARKTELTEAIDAAKDPKAYAELIAKREEVNRQLTAQITYINKAKSAKPTPAINAEDYQALYAKVTKEMNKHQADRAPAILEALKVLTVLMNNYSIEYEEMCAVLMRLNRQAGKPTSHGTKFSGTITDKTEDANKKLFDAFVNTYYNNVNIFRSYKE